MISLALIVFPLACQQSEKDTSTQQDSGTQDSGTEDTATEIEPSSEPSADGQSFLVLEEGASGGQIALRNTGDWENGEVLREASLEGKLVVKDEYVWLLNRGGSESIVQYDPSDFTQPKAEYVWEGPSALYPSDVAICEGQVFISQYYGSGILVLDENTFEVLGEINLDAYADDDGFAEASSLVCKKSFLYVSLHRFNQNEDPNAEEPQQIGSLWVMFDPKTWEEERQFPDQGYRSLMIDVPGTQVFGSVIEPHIDVTGTTGFWIYDPVADSYNSQIYFAYNDKTIFDTAIGGSRAVHLAYNYADNATWAFCHEYTPGQDQPGYSYERLVSSVITLDSVVMNAQDEAWLAFHKDDDPPKHSLMSIDSQTCQPNEDNQEIEHRIIDWLMVD